MSGSTSGLRSDPATLGFGRGTGLRDESRGGIVGGVIMTLDTLLSALVVPLERRNVTGRGVS